MSDKLFKILSDNSESIKKLHGVLLKEYPYLDEKNLIKPVKAEPVKKTVKKTVKKK